MVNSIALGRTSYRFFAGIMAICWLYGCAGAQKEPVQAPVSQNNSDNPQTPSCYPQIDCADNETCVDGVCQVLPPVACGKLEKQSDSYCEKSGTGEKIVLRGDILALDRIYEGGSVVVENGRITYVGCTPNLEGATVITCPDAVLSPAFINGHEHLTYSNARPAEWGAERYAHRNEWRKGVHDHHKIQGPRTHHNETVEIRALMSGTTSIFGSGQVKGLARNIDEETIEGVKSIYQTFPLGDVDGTIQSDSCDYNYHETVINSDDGCPFGPHLGEGISSGALNELQCLGGNGPYDIFRENLAMIHGVAATPEIISKMAKNNVKLIWSPRSNISLYGDTTMVPVFDRMGITIGFGTDWIYSGSATMFRELACADSVNRKYYNHYFSDYQLWRMPTWNNALAFGLEHALGAIKEGLLADIVIFKKTPQKTAYRAVIEAENKDVLLVMMNGELIYGQADLLDSGEDIDVCGEQRRMDLAKTGTDVTFAEAVKHAKYDMFFCGTPESEPSCTPERTRPEDTQALFSSIYAGSTDNDSDGDGIPDDADNCPKMFNPIRPMDNGKQADADLDGIGDICDEMPLCSDNNASCPVVIRNDYDNDGIENTIDNCLRAPNLDQKDTDNDGKGDACDSCPDVPNPGLMRCPVANRTTILQANDWILQTCTNRDAACRAQEEMLVAGRVTAVTSKGFFMQMPDSPDSMKTGIYVISADSVQVNDDVEVQAFPGRSSGMPVLMRAQVHVTAHDQKPIQPALVNAAAVTTGSPDAGNYTGMLVTLQPSVVKEHDSNAAYGMYRIVDTNAGEIYLDDFVWTIQPVPEPGTIFKHVVGVLVYDFGNYKIAPRNADDLSAE